jgi:hypothetical protein
VRAHLVKDPSDYFWSSYLAYVEREKGWGWLQTDFILAQVVGRANEAWSRYRRYVEEAMGKPIENPLEKAIASTLLGSEGFIEWVRGKWIKKIAPHRDIPSLNRFTYWSGLPFILKESENVFWWDWSFGRESEYTEV